MICEVYDYCPIQKDCEICPQWYKSYVKTCKEAGIEPTDMRSKPFNSFDITSAKGEDMTFKQTGKKIDEEALSLAQKSLNRMSYEEAAKELGVKEKTIYDYISKGKLKSDIKGYVTKESVENYKKERIKNLAKISKIAKTKKEAKPIDEATPKDEETTEYIVTKAELKEALNKALKLGYKKGKEECKREKLELKDLLSLIES